MELGSTSLLVPSDPNRVLKRSLSTYHHKLGTPTLLPVQDFNLKQDVKKLTDAFEKEDKDAVIEVLCNRSLDQRLEIAEFYQHVTSEKLTRSIKKLFSSDVAKMLCGLAVPYYEYLAHTIIHSRSFRWLYYILFTIPNDEILMMKDHFQAKYSETVENFITKSRETDRKNDEEQQERIVIGPIMKMLRGQRKETDDIDPQEVLQDVEIMEKINNSSYFDDCYATKQMVKNIFHYKSFTHIKLVCEEYSKRNGGDKVQDSIQKAYTYSFANDNIYNCFIKFAIEPVYYFSYGLKKSMKNLGTNDRLLSHIVVRRCEYDMVEIKAKFLKLYGESLREWIKSDTSSHYKYALYRLIGEERSRK